MPTQSRRCSRATWPSRRRARQADALVEPGPDRCRRPHELPAQPHMRQRLLGGQDHPMSPHGPGARATALQDLRSDTVRLLGRGVAHPALPGRAAAAPTPPPGNAASGTMATREPHGGVRLVAWADRSNAGADILAPEVDWAFASADSQPVFARGTAARLPIVWHAALSAGTHKRLGHNIPACGMMRRNLHINSPRRGLISTFTVERSGRLYGRMSR